MQGTNCLEDSVCPSYYNLRQFPWVFTSNKTCWYPSNVTYPTISAMSKMMKDYYEPVGSMSTQTLSISKKSIENGMNMFNIHAIIVKSVKINKE